MILYGQLHSKANSRRAVINRRTGKAMYIKSAEALECVASFQAQAREQWQGEPLEGPVTLIAYIYYPSRRQDLDESLLMDLLQGIAYHNDRQIECKVIRRGLDKVHPRVELQVEPFGG